MKYVLSTNGSCTIIYEARSTVLSGIVTSYCNLVTIPDSTVLLASLKASETSKFWLKSSVLAGIVTK